jgi:hypothetical protein
MSRRSVFVFSIPFFNLSSQDLASIVALLPLTTYIPLFFHMAASRGRSARPGGSGSLSCEPTAPFDTTRTRRSTASTPARAPRSALYPPHPPLFSLSPRFLCSQENLERRHFAPFAFLTRLSFRSATAPAHLLSLGYHPADWLVSDLGGRRVRRALARGRLAARRGITSSPVLCPRPVFHFFPSPHASSRGSCCGLPLGWLAVWSSDTEPHVLPLLPARPREQGLEGHFAADR